MRKTTQLRQLFEGNDFFILPGCATAYTAMMIEAIGYRVCYMSGGGTADHIVGVPDAGLTTMTEVVANGKNIANAIGIPLVCDSDTGWGNAVNVYRTVQEFIRAGVSGIHIEDQVSPKRCGFIAGKEVVPIEEAVSKYRAAVDARNELDPDFVLIARCDARTAVGGSLGEVLRRGEAYRKAGVNVLYLEAIQSMDELRTCVAQLGRPIMFTMGGIPQDQQPSFEQMADLGVSCAFLSSAARGSVYYRVLWEYLSDIKARGNQAIQDWEKWLDAFPWKYPGPPHRFDLTGFPKIRELEERYLSPEQMEKYAHSWGAYTPASSKTANNNKRKAVVAGRNASNRKA